MTFQVFLFFAGLSLLAVGGGSAIIPELYRQAVEEHRWLSGRQFVDYYALTQVTPGPSMMVVVLVGFQAAGWTGSLAAAMGMFGPSSLLLLLVQRGWQGLQASPWRPVLQRAARPLAVATMLASALLVATATNRGAPSWAITAVVALLVGSKRAGIPLVMALSGLAGWLLYGSG